MNEETRVLVIDDEPSTTTYLSTLLADHGFATRRANSADEGLRELEESRPDLILLDLLMPATTGINLFNKIKKDARYSDIPIIIVSGIRDHLVEDFPAFFAGLKTGRPEAFLEKPVDPDQLIQTVRSALAGEN